MKGIYDGSILIATFTEDPLEALKERVNLQGLSADEDYVYLDEEPIFTIHPLEGNSLNDLKFALQLAKLDLEFAFSNPETFDENRLRTHADGMLAISKVLKDSPKEVFHTLGLGMHVFSSRAFMRKAGREDLDRFTKVFDKIINILEAGNETRRNDRPN